MQTMPSPTDWRAPTTPEPPTQTTGLPGELIAIIAALIGAAAGLFLPWVTAVLPFVGQFSVSGLDTDDGKIIAVGLVILAGLVFAEYKTPNKGMLFVIALGFVAIGIAVLIDYQNATQRLAEVNSDDIGHASIGIGLYLCAAGAAVGGWSSCARLLKHRS